MKGKPKKFIAVKRGSTTVKVYPSRNGKYRFFTVCYYQEGRRVRKNYTLKAKAMAEAEQVVDKLHTGELQALRLTDQDRTVYVAAVERASSVNKRLDSAVNEYADALKELEGSGTILEAVRFFKRHHTKVQSKRVADVVAELLEAKKKDGLSEAYLHDLKVRLNALKERFVCPISDITTRELQDWLHGLPGSARSRNNRRNCVSALFSFAKTRGYLSHDRETQAAGLSKAKEVRGEVEIFSVEEMELLLAHASKEATPFLTIGAFAGLRHAEISRLDWKDVDLSQGHILVTAGKSKTAQRRIVPITENLAKWLTQVRDREGRVCLLDRTFDMLASLSVRAKLPWRANALRHSFGSYRLALIKNAAQVSLEMGNSPAMIFKHYREVVTEQEAKNWFVIDPEKVAQMKQELRKQAEASKPAGPLKKATGHHS